MLNKILDMLLFIWKLITPYFLGARCRHSPSCSQYSVDSIKEYGLLKGMWMGIKRISTCHPLHRD